MSGIPSLSEQRESLSQVCVLIFEYNVQLATRSVRAFFFFNLVQHPMGCRLYLWFGHSFLTVCVVCVFEIFKGERLLSSSNQSFYSRF